MTPHELEEHISNAVLFTSLPQGKLATIIRLRDATPRQIDAPLKN